MEDKEERLRHAKDLLHVLLEAVQELGLKLHVTRLVHSVHVAKRRSDGELLGDRTQGVPDELSVLSGGIELVRSNSRVVHSVLDAACDANLHFQDLVHGRHSLEVLSADTDVLIVGFLRQIEHVRAEEGLPVHFEMLLVCLEHAIKPREEFLRAVVRMDEDWDAVGGSHVARVMGTAAGTQNGRLLLPVRNRLAAEESGTALRELDDHWTAQLGASLEDRVDGAGTCAVEGRDGEFFGLRKLEQVPCHVTCDDAGLHPWNVPKAGILAHGC
mmetsp:Transcript_38623/g.84640  ORF Transcript_38623/g.84640 Transcript_38623/m.84640 type:complete len:271 (+) Transcript_38623:190-1002(+)